MERKTSLTRFFGLVAIFSFIFGLAGLVFLDFASPVYAAVPHIINYQGRLEDTGGNLFGGSSGANFDFRFSIWDVSSTSSGTKLWPAATTTVARTVVNGVFDARLGDASQGFTVLDLDFNTSTVLYLQIDVFNATTSYFETLSPRQAIVSAGFAINASTLNGFAQGTSSNNLLLLDTNGNINLPGGQIRTINSAACAGLTALGGGSLCYDTANNNLFVFNSASSSWTSLGGGGGGGSTLQQAYDLGNAIVATSSRDILFTLSDTAIDPNFIVNIQSSSTSAFEVQYNNANRLFVNSSTIVLSSPTTVSSTLTVTGATALQGIAFVNATGTSLALTSVSSTNISSTNITATGYAVFPSLNFTNASGANQTLSGNLTVGGLASSSELRAPSGTIATVAFTSASGTNLSASGYLQGASLTITTGATLVQALSFTNATGTSIALQTVSSTNVSSTNISATGYVAAANVSSTNVSSTNITATGYGLFPNLFFTSASGTNVTLSGYLAAIGLTFTNATGTNLTITGIASTSQEYVASSTITGLVFTNATGTNLIITGLASTSQLRAQSSTVGTLAFTSASGTNITASGYVAAFNVSSSNVSSTNITAGGYIQVPTLVATTNSVLGNASTSNLTVNGYLNQSGGIVTLATTTLGNASTSNITASGYVAGASLNVSGQATLTSVSSTNLGATGYIYSASVSSTNVSSTNISATGYGLFPTLNFTSASGTNITLSGYLTANNLQLTAGPSALQAFTFTNATGTSIGVSSVSSTNITFTNATGSGSLQVGTLTATGIASTSQEYVASSTITGLVFTNATSTGWLTVGTASTTNLWFVNATGSGNLNIGTITLGTSTPASSTALLTIATSSNILTVLNNGDIGIGTGTSSPVRNLQIGNFAWLSTPNPVTLSLGATYSNTAGRNIKLVVWEDGDRNSDDVGFGTSYNQLDYIVGTSNQSHVFYGNGTELMRIKSTGNVGIGTAAPYSKFNVAGLPPQTSTSSLVLLGSNFIVGGNASGTFLAANPTSTFNGDFINFQVNSSTVFNVSATGTVILAGNLSATGTLIAAAVSSTGLVFTNATGTNFTITGLASTSQLYAVSSTIALLYDAFGNRYVTSTSGGGITAINQLSNATITIQAGSGIQVTSSSPNVITITNTGTGAGSVNGTGTVNYYAIWTGPSTLSTSTLSQNGSDLVQNGPMDIYGVASTSQLYTASATITGLTFVNATGSGNLNIATITLGTSTPATNALFTVATTSNIFTVLDNGNVGIGTAAPITQLHVPGLVPGGAVGSAGTNNSPRSVYVQGRYAYVANFASNTLQVFDVSNPSSPTSVGSAGTNGFPYSVYVQGRYAYVVNFTPNTLQVFDVSNPSSPTSTGSVVTGNTPYSVYVQGRYAYVVNSVSNTLQVFDVSNPSSPTSVGSAGTGGNPQSVYVQGRYAYVANAVSSTLQVFNVSNPSSPTSVGSAETGGTPYSVYVQGRYAYVANYGASTLQVFDVSNPSAPTSTGSAGTGVNPYSVYVQGRYAYVANYGASTLQVFDVSNPSAPTSTGSAGTNSGPRSVYVQGRYAYVANYTSSTLQVFDVGGAYIQQFEAGGIEAGTLSVRDNLQAVDASFQGGVNIGQSLQVSGNVGIQGNNNIAGALTVGTTTAVVNALLTIATSSTNVFTVLASGKVGIGTTAPWSLLNVAGLPARTSTSSLVLLGSNFITGGNVSGTFLAANPTSTFNGDFINFQVNSSTVFNISATGTVILAGNLSATGIASTSQLYAASATISLLYDASGYKYVTSTSGASPGTPTGGIQYNESGAFTASTTFVFATSTVTLNLYGIVSSTQLRTASATISLLYDAFGNRYVTSTSGGGITAINQLSNATITIQAGSGIQVTSSSPNVITITNTGTGAGSVNGTGTVNYYAIWTGPSTLSTSTLSQNGTDLVQNGPMDIYGVASTSELYSQSSTIAGLIFTNATGTNITITGIASTSQLYAASSTITGLTFVNATSTGWLTVGNASATGLWFVNATGSGNLRAGTITLGTSTAATNALLTIATTSNIFTILNNGNVGIGTSSPQSKLHVYQPGDAQWSEIISDAGSTSSTTAFSLYAGGLRRWLIVKDGTAETGGLEGSDFRIMRYGDNGYAVGDTQIFIKRSTGDVQINSSLYSINNTGYVGIGTANPTTTLEVAGVVSSTGMLFVNATGTNLTITGIASTSQLYAASATISLLYDASGYKYVTSTSGASPGTPTGGIQYNESGAFTASTTFVFATSTVTLNLYGIVSSTQLRTASATIALLYDASGYQYVTSTGGGTPGGNPGEIQYNESGAFTGSSTFVFVTSTKTLNFFGVVSSTELRSPSSTIGGLAFTSASGTNLTITGLASTSQFRAQSSTVGTLAFTSASGTNVSASGYVASFNVSSTNVSSTNITAGGYIQGGGGLTITSGQTSLQSVSSTNLGATGYIYSASVSSTNVSSTNISATGYGLFPNLFFTSASGTNITLSGYLTANNLQLTSGPSALQAFTFTNATGTSIGVSSVSSTNITFTNATGTNLTITGIASTSQVYVASSTIIGLTFTNATGTGWLTVGNASATGLWFVNATGTNLIITGLASTSQLRAQSSTVGTLAFTSASGTNISASGYVAAFNVSSSNVSSTNISATGYGLFPNLYFTSATGTNLTITGIASTSQLYAASATISLLYDTSGYKYVTSTSGVSPGTPTGGIQYNESGAFTASSTFVFATSTGILNFYGVVSSTELRSPSSTIALLYDASGYQYVTSTGGGTPGGNPGEIQYNESGAFTGSSTFVFVTSTKTLNFFGVVSSTELRSPSSTIGGLAFTSASGTNLTITGLASTSQAYEASSTITKLTFVNASGTGNISLSSGYGLFPNLYFTSASGTNATLSGYLQADNLQLTAGPSALQEFTFTNATGTSIFVSSLSSTNITFANATGSGNLQVGTLTVTSLASTSQLRAQSSTVGTLAFTSASGTNLTVSGYGAFASVSSTNVSSTNISATGYGLFPTLKFTSASGTNISASGYVASFNVSSSNLSSTNITAGGYIQGGGGLTITSGQTSLQSVSSTNLGATGYIYSASVSSTNVSSTNITATGYGLFPNLYITTLASSSQLYVASSTIAGLVFTNATGTNLTITGIVSSTQFRAASSSLNGLTFVNATSTGNLRVGTMMIGTSTLPANALFVIATSTNIFTVLNNGNVGIGTTTPGFTFTVDSPSGTDVFSVDAATTSPTFILDVQSSSSVDFFTVSSAGVASVWMGGIATTGGLCQSGTNLNAATAEIRDIVVCSSGPSDIAEWYAAEKDVEPGDIVAQTDQIIEYDAQGVNPYTGGGVISLGKQKINILGKAANREKMISIVSTAPLQTFGTDVKDYVDAASSTDIKAVPIALIGRAPVKVSTENGPISASDYITLSSVPGVGMKAVKAGVTVGQALTDYDGDKVGTVLVFVNNGYFNGRKSAALPTGPVSGESILLDFLANHIASSSTSSLSEVFTDRLAAGLEVVTPRVVTDELAVNTITPVATSGINLVLSPEGKFSIMSSATGTASSTTNISFDASGNAFFAGEVSAKKISASQIQGLEVVTDKLSSLSGAVEVLSETKAVTTAMSLKVSGLAEFKGQAVFDEQAIFSSGATVSGNLDVSAFTAQSSAFTLDNKGNATFAGSITASMVSTNLLEAPIITELSNQASSTAVKLEDLAQRIGNLENIFSVGSSSTVLDLAQVSIKGALTVEDSTILNGGLKVNSIDSISDVITLMSDTIFFGRPYFNSDTGGFAKVLHGATSTDIVFSTEYLEQPVVSASISLEATSTGSSTADMANAIFASDIQYLVTNKLTTGFTVLLNKPAPVDITFSWIALAVKNAKTFNSAETAASSTAATEASTTIATSTAPETPLSTAASSTATSTAAATEASTTIATSTAPETIAATSTAPETPEPTSTSPVATTTSTDLLAPLPDALPSSTIPATSTPA